MNIMGRAFRQSWHREITFLRHSPWDLGLITLGPLLVILLLAWMLAAGVPRHLPIAVVDEDGSALSRELLRHLQATPSVQVAARPASLPEAFALLRSARVWGVVLVPAGAQARLQRGQEAGVTHFYNESFYSIAGAIESGVTAAVRTGVNEFRLEAAHRRGLPSIRAEGPGLKIVPLYNPQTSYELFLEPLAVMAILHLLLACAAAGALGRELRDGTLATWLRGAPGQPLALLLGKLAPYVLVFCAWTLLWLIWLAGWRGWKVQGSLVLLLSGQFLLYAAYATIAAWLALKIRDLASTLSLLAVYAGSSISFADVTLPIANAPLFTRFWSQIIPYTAYARLQMEQWVIGSPVQASLSHIAVLLLFTLIPVGLAWRLLSAASEKSGGVGALS